MVNAMLILLAYQAVGDRSEYGAINEVKIG